MKLQPKKTILEMKSYADPGEGRMGFVRLDFNENSRGASPKVIEAIRTITAEECGCHPEYGELKQALARFLNAPAGTVLPTNGSDEAIKAIFDVYVDKGDEVILLTPGYSMYEIYAQAAGAKITWIAYREDFSFPLEEVLKAIEGRTRLIALASPNNPLGKTIPKEGLRRIIESNPEMVVLVDEAYGEFAKESNLELVLKYPNVLITRTFSKAYGLAGLRIGYLVSCEENTADIAKLLAPSYSVDRVAAAAAMAAIQDQPFVEAYVEEILQQRQRFVLAMERLGFEAVQSDANFVLVRFGDLAEKVRSELMQKGILVRERREERLKGYLRISIGLKEQMQMLIEAIESIVGKAVLLFDMDGVLVDESGSYRQCILQTVFAIFGKAIDRSLVEEFKNRGGCNNDYDCVERILEFLNVKANRNEIIDKFDAFYAEFKHREMWLLDEKKLVQLKMKYRLGIFTGRPKKDAWDALERFKKGSFFDVVITNDDVEEKKPSPEGILLALKKLNRFKAVYVGDNRDDAEAARRAKVDFIGVIPPGGANSFSNGADIVLERIGDIVEVLCPKES